MRQNNSKQLQRKENKDRKMSALYMISSLNERDRMKAIQKSSEPVNISEDMDYETEEDKKTESKKRKLEEMEDNSVKGNPNIIKQELTEDEVKQLRILIRQRFAAKKHAPKLKLKLPGLQAKIEHPPDLRIPIFFSDVQHFIIYSLLGHMSTGNIPRWVSIEKFSNLEKVLFLVVEGMSLDDYTKHEAKCPKLKSFSYKLEVVTPLSYGGSVVREIATLPLTESQKFKLEKNEFGIDIVREFSTVVKKNPNTKICKVLRTMFPINLKKIATVKSGNHTSQLPRNNSFSRTELLLLPWQMLEEGYPLAIGELKSKYTNYVFTKDTYDDVSPDSPMWALDCEMSLTNQGSELVRLSVVDEKLQVVYETFVKPHNPIINHLTEYSGVTAKHLKNVNVRLEDVQKRLREILPPNVILIGHSLNMDLHALRMFHPYIIDTSVIFNLSGRRAHKTKLKTLSAEFLGDQIQTGRNGHDSVEDAIACMKLVQAKLKHSLDWGDAVISGTDAVEMISAQTRNLRQKEKNKKKNVTSADSSSPLNAQNYFTCANESWVVRTGHSLPKYVKGDEVLQVEMLTTSLFSHLISRNKKSLLVAKSNVLNEFFGHIPDNLQLFRPNSRLQISEQQTNRAIIKFGRNNAPDSGATIMYAVVNRKPDLAAIKVDQLVTKMTQNIANNVLICVLLAGRSTDLNNEVDPTNHGLLLLHLHQEPISPIKLDRDIHK